MRLVAITAFIVLIMACVLPAWALTHDSTLTGTLGSIDLHAEAVFADGWWTYTYTATITNASANVTGLTVANLSKLYFEQGSNNKNFKNPEYTGTDSIIWSQGNVPSDQGPCIFSFKSQYAPKLDSITLWGGIKKSAGTSYSLAVPEPSSLAAFGVLSLGCAARLFRRRRSRSLRSRSMIGATSVR